MEQFQNLKQQLQETVRQRMDMSSELSDAQIGEIIDSVIMEKSREVYMSAVTKLTLRQELFNAIRRLDLLQELIDDKTVTEIMVNGADAIFYERDGRIYTWDRHFESREKLEDVIQQIVSRSNRQVNESIPIVDARLKGRIQSERCPGSCGTQRADSDNQKISRGSDHNGGFDPLGVHQSGGGRIFESACESRVQHIYQRGYQYRENNIFECSGGLHS